MIQPRQQLAAILSDPDASSLYAALDLCEENDLVAERHYLSRYQEAHMVAPPIEVGQEWFFCTVTLYYVGRVKQKGLGWVLLEDASWVHWTGRLSVLLKGLKFSGTDFGSRKPRTEFCGEVLVSTDSIVSAYPGPWKLPRESVQ